LKKNGIKIGGKSVENLFVNMMFEKRRRERDTNLKKTQLHASLLENGLNRV
jgi:hypothetical protein